MIRKSKSKKITPELLAVDSLIMNDTELAKKYSVDRVTIYRHKQSDAFKREFQKVKEVAYNDLIDKAKGTAIIAFQTLQDIMTNKRERASTRVASAKILLEFSFASRVHDSDTQKNERITCDDTVHIYLPDNGRGDMEVPKKK